MTGISIVLMVDRFIQTPNKDCASRLLAEGLEADAFLILTDAPAVATHYGYPDSLNIRCVTPEAMDPFTVAAGGQTVECVRDGGKMAAIGSLEQSAKILTLVAGTVIRQDGLVVSYE